MHFVVIPQAGRAADRLGRRSAYLLGALGTEPWGFFAFPMMDNGRYPMTIAAIALGLVFQGLMLAPQPSPLAEMFPTQMRYSGVSLGYQVTAIFAGSMAPIIAVKLLQTYKSSVPIALYLAGAALITLCALAFARETRGIDLAAVDAADAAGVAR